jgi:hypothetical protein
VVLALAAPTRADDPPEIPRVKTLAELRAVAAVDTGDGWSVRLGYGEPDDDLGASWRVLYCLAEPAPADAPDGRPREGPLGDPLGPVSYTWEPTPRANEEALSRMQRAVALTRPGLYCATLPAGAAREMRVTVNAPGERVLARRAFPPEKGQRPAYWHTFAESRPKSADDVPVSVVADEAAAAYPLFRGWPVRLPDEKKPAGEPGAHDDLPGLGGAGEADGLRLTLEGGAFVIATDRGTTRSPNESFLARWWVNGRPVAAPRPGAERAKFQQRLSPKGAPVTVGFGLPDHLPALKPGDRVALRLMYAAEGQRLLPFGTGGVFRQQQMRAVDPDAVDRPLLSNRLEFEVTDELLAEADLPKPDGEPE